MRIIPFEAQLLNETSGYNSMLGLSLIQRGVGHGQLIRFIVSISSLNMACGFSNNRTSGLQEPVYLSRAFRRSPVETAHFQLQTL